MNNKLIFRILGALASALIAVSVFLPYVSVTGYSESLWQIYKVINTLYLPIMIIIFGIIGVIFFALNIKTEFAYTSAGAVLFFVVMQTFDVVNQGTFNTLSVGYYCLVIGSVLTGIMAFLCNLNSRKSKKIVVENSTINTPPSNQMNNMSQNIQQENIPTIEAIDNIPLIPISDQTINPIQDQVVIPEQVVQPILEVIPEQSVMSVPEVSVVPEPVVQPIPEIQPQVSIPELVDVQVQSQSSDQQLVNPVVEQFVEKPVNPVIQEFMVSNSQPQSTNIDNQQPIIEQVTNSLPLNSVNEPIKENPVVQEFTNPSQGLQINQNNNVNEVDIFGQPINK